MNIDYIVEIISSIIRMSTPLIYCGLAAAICTKANIFNISMEGSMMAGAFFAIVANYYTGSVVLSIIAAMLAGAIVCSIVGFLCIKLKANAVVVGIATNILMGGLTTYLLYLIFDTRGVFTSPSLVSLPKVDLVFLNQIPVLNSILGSITYVDLFAFVLVIIVYFILYKTLIGFRLRAIGSNFAAAKSLGTQNELYQFITITVSGLFCGLAGTLLSMGSVTLFIQNITSGRGYIALAANSLGKSSPIGVLCSSVFFGFTSAIGNFLQNTAIRGQLTAMIPYVATVIALVFFSIQKSHKKKNELK